MNLSELQQLAANIGFPDPALAAAIAMAESTGDPNAVGDVSQGGSIGLWQINLRSFPQFSAAKLHDPEYNARAAYTISNGGRSWNLWTAYRTGTYKKWYAPLAENNSAFVFAAALLVLGVSTATAYYLYERGRR
jgi:hypothetical protein